MDGCRLRGTYLFRCECRSSNNYKHTATSHRQYPVLLLIALNESVWCGATNIDTCTDKKCGDARARQPSNMRHPLLKQATAEDDQVISGSDEPPTLEQQRQAAAAAAARGKQLNVVCNDVVRTILDGNVTNEKERALALRLRLEEQRDALVSPDDAMSALFYDNLLLVCQHELHPDVDRLSGEYGKAWRTILHYVEDAGWQLTDPPFSISG